MKNIKWLEQSKEWAGLKSIFAIKRVTKRNGKTGEEVSFYISSLKKSAQELTQYLQEH